MAIQFDDEKKGDVRLLRVSGSWTGGQDDDPLRAAFNGWVEAGDRIFVMDLSALDLLNSIGLGKLVTYYSTLTRAGGRIALAGMSDRNRRAAHVARILDLFEEFDDGDEAVKAMGSASS